MPTPISVHTIDGNNDYPEPHDYELTLTFQVTQYGSPVDPELALALNRIFDDWNEGRHPLPVEMIDDGMQRCIKNALYQCCQKRAQEKYGNEMVQTSPTSSTARWALEGEKEFDKLWKSGAYPGWHSTPNIKIERTEHSDDH
jgi:hypothetical protein